MGLKELGLSELEYRHKLASSPLGDALEKYGKNAYAHGLLCCLSGKEDLEGAINEIMNKN